MAEALEERIARLEDVEAIRNLIASYGPLADAGDAKSVAKLWTQDGEYDVGGFGVAKGRDEIAALIDSDTHRALMSDGCAHILSPPRIEVDGNFAKAIGYSMVVRKQAERFEAWRVSINYWSLKRQSDNSWLVCSRINRPLGKNSSAAMGEFWDQM